MAHSINFCKAVKLVFKVEGGYVDHPDDPGGRTMYGIAEKYHPQAWVDGPPSRDAAAAIYHDQYWKPSGAHRLESYELAALLLDGAVNSGSRRAVRHLQEAFNKIQGRKVLVEDGKLGPITARNINQFTAKYNDAMVMAYVGRRIRFYYNNNPIFLKGWFWRVAQVLRGVL